MRGGLRMIRGVGMIGGRMVWLAKDILRTMVLTVEGVMEWVEVEWPPQDIDYKSSLRSLALLNHNVSS